MRAVTICERMHRAEWGGRCGHPQSQDPQETCEDRIRNPRCGAGRCKWKRAHLRRRRCWCRKVMATEEKSRPEEPRRRRRVESRRRVARGKGMGTTPRVWRPGRFPRQNPAPAGPKHPCGELPNGLKPRRVENYRVGFQPRENGGIPTGKAAAKVAQDGQFFIYS